MNAELSHLKALANDFTGRNKISEKELHKNKCWKKLMRTGTEQRYHIVRMAFRGILQQRDPGFQNGLWLHVVEHDLDYMLRKADPRFLNAMIDEILDANHLEALPFELCNTILKAYGKSEYGVGPTYILARIRPKYVAIENPSETLTEWVNNIETVYPQHTFDTREKGTYFVDSFEEESAWHKLDEKTKRVVQNYEEELFYDRSPKPTKEEKDKVIKAINDSDLNKKHKKALVLSIKKKG